MQKSASKLSCVVIPLCVWAIGHAQSAQQTRQKAIELLAKFSTFHEFCAVGYAMQHRDSPLTATELAEAALALCKPYLEGARKMAVIATNAAPQRFAETTVSNLMRDSSAAVLRAIAENGKASLPEVCTEASPSNIPPEQQALRCGAEVLASKG